MATPFGADNAVNWSTSNPLVATVDEYGWVTGVGRGSATITARAIYAEGNVTASCVVTVTAPITISGTVRVTINGTPLSASDFDLDVFTDSSLDYRFYIDTADVDSVSTGSGIYTWSITLPAFDADTTLYFGIDVLNSMLGVIKTEQTVAVKDQDAANIAVTVNMSALTLSGTANVTIDSSPVSADGMRIYAYANGKEIGYASVNSDNTWVMGIFALSSPTTVLFKLEADGVLFDTGVTRSVYNTNVSSIALSVTGTTKTITGTLNGNGLVFALSAPVAGFYDLTIISKMVGETHADWEGDWTMTLPGTAPVNLWFLAGVFDEETEEIRFYITSSAVNTSGGTVVLHTSNMTYLESFGADEE